MIEYNNIMVSFGQSKIFDNFSLKIEHGEKVLLSGKSGSGKTTLLRMLLGFESRYNGEIYFDKLKVNEKNIWEVRKQIAYIPQTVDMGEGRVSQWFRMIFEYKWLKHLNISEEKIASMMEFVELKAGTLHNNIEELSGGERQRLAIAAALLTERKVFVIDEATAALDADLKKRMVRIFNELNDSTVIAVSHDNVWSTSGMRIVNIGGKHGS